MKLWSWTKSGQWSSAMDTMLLRLADRLLLLKCYDNKMAKSPYNCFIFPLKQPEVANQQKKRKKKENTKRWL